MVLSRLKKNNLKCTYYEQEYITKLDVPKMNFHFPLLFHQHLFYWRIAWQLPCICETSSVNILKVNFYSCGWVWSFFFSFFSWGRRDRSVLKAISLWWQVWLSVPRKYGLIFFFSIFFNFRARCISLITILFYHIKLISFLGGSSSFCCKFLANPEAQIVIFSALYLENWKHLVWCIAVSVYKDLLGTSLFRVV